jgi:hypothetical protein
MLHQKCFCLPLWVWLVAIGLAVYYYCYAPKNKLKNKPKDEKKKEKFTNSKVKIYNFNTEWCGWSRRFQPEWEKFTRAVKSNSELDKLVEVINVRCDDSVNEKLCEKYNVPGYPYVVLDDNGEHTPYTGERTAEALLSFVSF